MKAKKRIDFEKMFYAVCAIACFFLFWWFITAYTPAGETTPGPIEVIRLLIDSFFEPIGNYVITGHLLVSLRRVLVGFFVATILGIILGIGMGTSKWAEAIFKPVFELLRPIPPHRLDITGHFVLWDRRDLQVHPLRHRRVYERDPQCVYRSPKCGSGACGMRPDAGDKRAGYFLPGCPSFLHSTDICGDAGGAVHKLDGGPGR